MTILFVLAAGTLEAFLAGDGDGDLDGDLETERAFLLGFVDFAAFGALTALVALMALVGFNGGSCFLGAFLAIFIYCYYGISLALIDSWVIFL